MIIKKEEEKKQEYGASRPVPRLSIVTMNFSLTFSLIIIKLVFEELIKKVVIVLQLRPILRLVQVCADETRFLLAFYCADQFRINF